MSEAQPPARFISSLLAQNALGLLEWRRSAPLWLIPLLIALFAGVLAAPLHAQLSAAAPEAGVIAGRVVDAHELHPLGGAIVALEALGPRAVGAVERLRSVSTDSVGEYRFESLPLGRYRVRVQRMGYRSATVHVELRSGSTARLSVALELVPLLLPILEVKGEQAQPFPRPDPGDGEIAGGRREVARERQLRYMVSDAREITRAEVVEAVTLGESDLFRAMQRIPGVTTRDDYTATLWTRGAPWDQTRVYFDGLPLYNPTHAGWLFSAVNPEALGEVAFHPGVRSARWGEGAAAVLDLRSRSGGNHPGVRGSGELSLVSARVALDGRVLDDRLGWMVAVRRTYVDLLGGLAKSVTDDPDLSFPYDFSDLVVRLDGRVGRGWGYEASTILERDYLRGDLPRLLIHNRGRWGNHAGQLTLIAPVGPLQARIMAGETRFGTTIHDVRTLLDPPGGPPPPPDPEGRTLPELKNSIGHRVVGVQLAPAGAQRDPPWSAGYQFVQDSVTYNGSLELPTPRTLLSSSSLQYSVLWGEGRWSPLARLQLQLGVRVELGEYVANGGRTRTAPRVAAEYHLGPATSLSAGWSRSYQYTQDISPAAGPVGPQLHLSHLWVLAQPKTYTAVRADVATLGGEHWVGETWLLGATAYRRHATGVMVANPYDGPVLTDRRPQAVAINRARGVELSARKLAGRWTGSLGYTLGRSTLEASAALTESSPDSLFVYDSPSDVRHTLDATARVRLDPHWSLGGAFTYASGAPYTRLVIPAGDLETNPPLLGKPQAERGPSYASLDFMLEYTRQVRSWRLSGYLQLRNALNRNNSVAYAGTPECRPDARSSASAATPPCGSPAAPEASFQPGLPRLPLVGVRFAF